MRILVRSPNWIGDCIMSIPAFRVLRRYFPKSIIGVACQNNLGDIFENISEIDQTLTIERSGGLKGFFRTAGQLGSWGADMAILFTNSFYSALLVKASGIKTAVGYRKDFRGILLNRKLKFPRLPYHQVDFYLDLIHDFGREYSSETVQVESPIPIELHIKEQEINNIERWLTSHGIDFEKRMIGISSSAAYGSSKEWLPERFIELLNRLNDSLQDTQFLFFGSNTEQQKIELICRQCQGNIFNLAGKLSLKQSIAAISRCRFFVSNDSGLMHVASALQIPLTAIFGPTDPGLTAPRSGIVTRIHRPVECAPCKYRECPIDHRCMTGIQVDDVYDAVMDMLSEERSRRS